jgi:AcrR family transcriptional regulator
MPRPSAVTAASDNARLDGRRVRGAATRRKIVATAWELFRTRGFHAVSVDDIAEKSGVTGPAIYRHFTSKDELLEELLAPAEDVLYGPLPTGSAEQVLQEFFRRVTVIASTHPDAISLYHQEWHSLSAERRQRHREAMTRRVDQLARILRKARPELTIARARLLVGLALTSASYVGHPGAPPRADDSEALLLVTTNILKTDAQTDGGNQR